MTEDQAHTYRLHLHGPIHAFLEGKLFVYTSTTSLRLSEHRTLRTRDLLIESCLYRDILFIYMVYL